MKLIRHFPLAVAGLLLLAALSCATTPPAVQRELDLAAQDAYTAAEILEPGDPDLAERLRGFGAALEGASARVEAAIDSGEDSAAAVALDALDGLLAASEPLLESLAGDEEGLEEARAYVLVAQAALRRTRAYLE